MITAENRNYTSERLCCRNGKAFHRNGARNEDRCWQTQGTFVPGREEISANGLAMDAVAE
jgi:hypothetical protein